MNPWDYVTKFSESPLGQDLMTANRVIGQGVGLLGNEASRAADDYFNNTIPGQLTKNTWNAASYLMQGPQQAVFGFGKEGSDAFGKMNSFLQNKGMDNLPATFLSAVGSIPAGLYGANKAALFSGRGNDIRGGQLADGLFDNPKYDKAVGLGFDFTADPWVAGTIPIASRMGTFARTAKNLWQANTNNPSAYERVTKGGLWNALKADISQAGAEGYADIDRAQGAYTRGGKLSPLDALNEHDNIPMIVRQEKDRDISNLASRLTGEEHKGVAGLNFTGDNLIMGSKVSMFGDNPIKHETLHNTLDLIPGNVRVGFNRNMHKPLQEQQPVLMKNLEPFYMKYYKDDYEKMIAEEGLANLFERNLPPPIYEGARMGEMLDKLFDVANKRYNSFNVSPATPLPLDPASINRVRVAYDEWK